MSWNHFEQNAVSMEPNERMRTMLNLMGEDGGAVDVFPTNRGDQNVERNPLTTAAPPAPTQVTSAIMDGHQAYTAHSEDGQVDLDDAQKDELVASYCGITGADPDAARHLLEVRNENLEIQMFII